MHLRPAPQLPSEHRVSRFQLWLTLTLVWFVAHLAAIAPNHARRFVHRARRYALTILALRASRRLPASHWRPYWRNKSYDPLWRVAPVTRKRGNGSAIHRALRGRNAADIARAIYRALTEDAERWIAHLLRRMQRPFSRLRRFFHPPLVAGALRGANAFAFASDTS